MEKVISVVVRGFTALAFAATLSISPAFSADPPSGELISITPELIKAAQREGSMSFRYSAQKDYTEAIASDFMKQFPGIRVDLDRRVGTAGTQQFATEERAGKHIVDVHLTTDRAGLIRLSKEGLYLNFSPADIRNNFPPQVTVPGWGYSAYWTETVLPYNPQRITAQRAQTMFATWNGLLDPSLKGRKIGIVAPNSATQSFTTMWMLLESPKYGKPFFEKLMAQTPVMFRESGQGREALGAGEIDVLIGDVESLNVARFVEGSTLQWTYPESVPSYASTFHAISKNAPHPNAARLYVAWITSRDGAASIMRAGVRPTMKGVPDERPAIAKLKQTPWWKPYPEANRWIPDANVWDAQYEKVLKELNATLGIK